MNTNLSLTITSLKWTSMHFFCGSVRLLSWCSELLFFWEECLYPHDHHCSPWTSAASPARMSQGIIKAGGVFMSLLQCTLPAKQMPTSTSVSGKGVAGCACTPGPVLHPRQHTQVSATWLLVAFVWKWGLGDILSGSTSWGMKPAAAQVRVTGQFCNEEEADNKILALLSVAHYNYCIGGQFWDVAGRKLLLGQANGKVWPLYWLSAS